MSEIPVPAPKHADLRDVPLAELARPLAELGQPLPSVAVFQSAI